VWDDTTTSNGGFDERVQFLVSSDGQLQVARGDTFHLEILGRVTSQLEHFGGEVLCEVQTKHGHASGSVFLPPFAQDVRRDAFVSRLLARTQDGGAVDGCGGSHTSADDGTVLHVRSMTCGQPLVLRWFYGSCQLFVRRSSFSCCLSFHHGFVSTVRRAFARIRSSSP